MAQEPSQRTASSNANARNTSERRSPEVEARDAAKAAVVTTTSGTVETTSVEVEASESQAPSSADKKILVSTVPEPRKVRLANGLETIIPPYGKTGSVADSLLPEQLPVGIIALVAPTAKKE